MSSLSLDRIIFTVPSGRNVGLTPDTLNLREANFDVCTVGGVDIGSIVVDAAAHIAATSGVHGVVGDVVGTTDAQTLSNKTISTTSFFANNVDTTKRIAFNTSGATTSTTTTFTTMQTGNRAITFPDITDTVVTLTATQTLTNKSIQVPSTKFIDDVDATKRVTFDTSGATTGRTTTFFTSQTVDRSIAFPNTSDTVVVLDLAQTLTNKTLTLPIISQISNTGTLTLPTSTDTLVGRATTDALSNKTFQTTTCQFIDAGDVTKRINFAANLASGGATLTLSSVAAVNRTMTFPDATDIVVVQDLAQTLTNKTLTLPIISSISNGGTLTLPTGPDTLVARASTDALSNKTFQTTTCHFVDAGDATKRVGFDTSGATTGTTTTFFTTQNVNRSITFPNTTGTLVAQNFTQALTNKTLSTADCFWVDGTDSTKNIFFNLASATTGTLTSLQMSSTTNRQIIFPDATDTLVGRSTSDTLANKAISSATNTITVGGTNITLLLNQDVRNSATPTWPTVNATSQFSVSGTNQSGVLINQTLNLAETQNGLRITSNAVDKIRIGHNQALDRTYVTSTTELVITGSTVIMTMAPSTSEVRFSNCSRVTLTLNSAISFGLFPNSVEAGQLAYSLNNAEWFSSSLAGDINVRHAVGSRRINIGVGSGTAQVVVASALTTFNTDTSFGNIAATGTVSAATVSATSSVSVSGTSTAGVSINQTLNLAQTQNGVTISSDSVSKLLLGHSQAANQSYVNSSVDLITVVGGSTRMTISASTGEISTQNSSRIALYSDSPTSFGFFPAGVERGQIAYSKSNGDFFSSALANDINIRNTTGGSRVNIGVGGGAAQIIVGSGATVFTTNVSCNTDMDTVNLTVSGTIDTNHIDISGDFTANGPSIINGTLLITDQITITPITTDNNAIRCLLLSLTDNVVERPIADGVYTSTWTTTGGFTAFTNAISRIVYFRFGNTVTCTCVFDKASAAGGTNSATVTLPIARSGNFAAVQEAAGVLALSPNPSGISMTGGFVRAVVGSSTTILLTLAGVSGAGDVTIIGSFQYTLS